MPRRVSRPSNPAAPRPSTTKKQHAGVAPKKRKNRHLNAYSIATTQSGPSSRVKIAQHRLGETEEDVDQPRQKRRRLTDDDELDGFADKSRAGEGERSQRKNVRKGGEHAGFGEDELDVDYGSDSEGNEWRMGDVEGEADSEVDSDEAFDEEDEKRFEGFVFRGSRSGRKEKKRRREDEGEARRREGGVDLNEGGEDDSGDDESLGSDAVDLADMLDDDSDEEIAPTQRTDGKEKLRQTERLTKDAGGQISRGVSAAKGLANSDGEEELEQDEGFGDDSSSPSEDNVDGEGKENDLDSASSLSEDDAEDNDPEKLEQLQDIVDSLPKTLPQDNENSQSSKRPTALQMLEALKSQPNMDPILAKSLKTLSRSIEGSSNTVQKDEKSLVIQPPKPKRQQDRLDREAAYKKAKETLDRWLDTVKANRRAEHLVFPLPDPEAVRPQGERNLAPTGVDDVARTNLEREIENIMLESGLATKTKKGKVRTIDTDEMVIEAENLAEQKLSLEEVRARRAELRKTRDLLFREEVRAKRINKIKSKSYRRLRRKGAEKAARKERELLLENGFVDEEAEQEAADRRRAEERMGTRHRDSKWAKGMKASGRTVWDNDARDGVLEMARKEENLRKRIEGKKVTANDGDGSELDISDSESDDGEDSGFRLRKQLDTVSGFEDSGEQKGLAGLKFMQRAETARKKENDEAVAMLQKDLRRELDGDADSDEHDSEPEPELNLGRRLFGPSEVKQQEEKPAPQPTRNEFEEGFSSADEEDELRRFQPKANGIGEPQPTVELQPERPPARDGISGRTQEKFSVPSVVKPHSAQKSSVKAQSTPKSDHTSKDNHTTTTANKTKPTLPPSDPNHWPTITLRPSPALSRSPSPHSPSNEMSMQDIVRSAFAGDDDTIAASFAAEKATVVAEDAQPSDTEDPAASGDPSGLPGWGSWTGAGISKQYRKDAAKRKAALAATKGAKETGKGVKAGANGVRKREDANKPNVIVSQKRARKNVKYLAPNLPHPFETRAQYERSLRMPVGPEWTTKDVFQKAVKPRVIVKRKGVIEPMRRPLV